MNFGPLTTKKQDRSFHPPSENSESET